MDTETRSSDRSAAPAGKRLTPWVGRGLLAVALVFLLQSAKPLLLPVIFAMTFALVLSAPMRRLRRLGVPNYVAAGLVVGSLLCIAALLVSVVATPAAEWWARAPSTLAQLLDVLERLRRVVFPVTGAAPVAAIAGTTPDALAQHLSSEGFSLTRVALVQVLAFAVSASATVFLLYFLLASEHWLLARTIEAIPRRRTRALVLGGLRQAQRDVGSFVVTMGIISVGLGIATGFALAIVGLPSPVLWGTCTAILTFVPYIGPMLVALLLLLAGSVTFGSGVGMLAPPAAFLALHFIESNFISPLVMGHRLRLSPVFVFLSVLVWAWLWGVAGAFIAVPLLLALRAVCKRTRGLRLVGVYLEGSRGDPPSLRSLLKSSTRTARDTSAAASHSGETVRPPAASLPPTRERDSL